VRRHWVASNFAAKRREYVNTALRPFVAKAQVPMDRGHALTNTVACRGLVQPSTNPRRASHGA